MPYPPTLVYVFCALENADTTETDKESLPYTYTTQSCKKRKNCAHISPTIFYKGYSLQDIS